MAMALSNSEDDGFLFTWKVKNINVCFFEERIDSPKFMAYSLYRSSWIMSLDPAARKDFNLNLQLLDTNVEDIDVFLTVTVVTPSGKEFVLNHDESFLFDCGDKITIASPQHFLFFEETLIFNCRMVDSQKILRPFVNCKAHTFIGSEKRCCIWKIRNFASMLPKNDRKYTFFSTASRYPELEIHGSLSNNRMFHLKVHVVSQERITCTGKLAVLTPNNNLKWSKKSSFLVEADWSKEETIFTFPLIIDQKSIPNDLWNGDLYLLCDFSISTGTMHSEIDESNFLAEEYSNLLKEKQINLSTKNLLDKSTPQSEKNPTQDNANVSHSSENNMETLKGDLKNFYLQKNHCDVTFHIKAEMLPAHKSILCSRSPVFSAMFDSNMKESINKKVEIVDMDIDTMDQFLLFLYSETIEDLTWERASKLLYAANKYQVESLKAKCSSFLLSNISRVNACEALKMSDLYQDEKLKLASLNLVFKHATEIFVSKEWEILTLENPLLSAKTMQSHFIRSR